MPLEAGERAAAIVMRLGKLRLDRDGPIEARDRVFVALEGVQRRAAIAPVGRGVWRERQRPLVARHRLGMAVKIEQHVGAAAMGIGKIRLLGDQAVERRQRFVVAAEPMQRHAEQFVGAGIGRIGSERLLNDRDRLRKVAALAQRDRLLHQSCGLSTRHCADRDRGWEACLRGTKATSTGYGNGLPDRSMAARSASQRSP